MMMTMDRSGRPAGDEARIGQAAEPVRDMTKDVVDALPAQRVRLADGLQWLFVAFLLKVLVARRH
jgi:hypothetical protein